MSTPGLRLKFQRYSRPFRSPLTTRYGEWSLREGILLQLQDQTGAVGLGEIAPLPWFGSETVEQALDFCQQLPAEIDPTTIFSIPTTLPACQFGFESAWEALTQKVALPKSNFSPLTYCGLLPTGKTALQTWSSLWEQGYRTFKWKIGVAALTAELAWFQTLIQILPANTKLRLDANGGLDWQAACAWLTACDHAQPVEIEYLEQPLAVDQFAAMQQLSDRYRTPVALDESVGTLNQLEVCYKQGWRGIFVIKPAIAGSPQRLRQFCQHHQIEAVFSSVFETRVGRQAALKLAADLSYSQRAVGFGVDHWFAAPDLDQEIAPEA